MSRTKTIIQMDKTGNENGANLLRKFSRRVKDSGILRHVRKNRYAQRNESSLVQKRGAIRRIEKQKEIEKLRKLGKIGR
jgi:hypothetical protein